MNEQLKPVPMVTPQGDTVLVNPDDVVTFRASMGWKTVREAAAEKAAAVAAASPAAEPPAPPADPAKPPKK